MKRPASVLLAFSFIGSLLLFSPPCAYAWGEHGHMLIGRAAATNLPKPMPSFFRKAAAQLEYLNPEPDRWKDKNFPEMYAAYWYDHFLDWELVPEGALDSKDRYEYLIALHKSGLNPPQRAGFLPFHILELYQRLRKEFNLWRHATDKRTRRWIEERVISDAGILGHYVADGSTPLHTTVHYTGWVAGYLNPNHYTTDKTFHDRFEIEYVRTHILIGDILPGINANPRVLNDPRAEIMAYLAKDRSFLLPLYELEKEETFNARTTAPDHKQFAIDRLTAGANMLRDIWWSAWVKSEQQ